MIQYSLSLKWFDSTQQNLSFIFSENWLKNFLTHSDMAVVMGDRYFHLHNHTTMETSLNFLNALSIAQVSFQKEFLTH